jgi:hypothetical protein
MSYFPAIRYNFYCHILTGKGSEFNRSKENLLLATLTEHHCNISFAINIRRLHAMKKFITALSLLALLPGIFTLPSFASDSSTPTILLNNEIQHFDQDPVIIQNRTLVPLRGILEKVGAQVQWDETTNTVTTTKDSTIISLPIGSTHASVNGKTIDFDVPAQLIHNRTMIPLRLLAESLGLHVGWDVSRNEVTITSPDAPSLQTPPAAPFSSRFMGTVDPATLYAEGKQLGNLASAEKRDDLIVLDFGWPQLQKDTGTHGTQLFSDYMAGKTFATNSQIAQAVQAFAQGYHDQVSQKQNIAHSQLVIAIGTNNKQGISNASGQTWAALVDQVNTWVKQQQDAEIKIAAASDMELGWNTAQNTRSWVDGYKAYFSSNGKFAPTLYNYGDAAGCPPYGRCNGGWTQDDVWYISWGSGVSAPLPEIYTTTGSQAKEWANLVKYSFTKDPNHPMIIAGVMTQYQSCLDQNDHSGTDNTPAQGRSQLWNALNADEQTAQTLKNPQTLRWVTDITWQN